MLFRSAHAVMVEGEVWLRGLVATTDGSRVVRAEARGKPAHALALGERVAMLLREGGADEVLASLGPAR